ncbi:MAG: hypothetical protein HY314_12435 [Acidobacteria bacterium]|nr:hypothetical protein [Acidobacteriota bacterium]
MKKLLALGGLISPAILLAPMSLMVPHGAFIALVVIGGTVGGVGALLSGLGGIIFEFILAFIVSAGLTPMELLLGL